MIVVCMYAFNMFQVNTGRRVSNHKPGSVVRPAVRLAHPHACPSAVEPTTHTPLCSPHPAWRRPVAPVRVPTLVLLCATRNAAGIRGPISPDRVPYHIRIDSITTKELTQFCRTGCKCSSYAFYWVKHGIIIHGTVLIPSKKWSYTWRWWSFSWVRCRLLRITWPRIKSDFEWRPRQLD